MYQVLALVVNLVARAPFLVTAMPMWESQNGKDVVVGERMVIENPLKRAVTVTIHCGGLAEYDESHVRIDPRTRLTIEVLTDPPSDFCAMTDWR